MKLSFTLSQYLARSFLFWSLMILLVVMVLISLFDFSEVLRRSSSKFNIPGGLILQLVLFKLPFLLQQVLAFIVLFATMFLLWQLNRHNEITIARAAGVSIWQMLFPLVAVAFMIGAFDLIVINPLSSTLLNSYKTLNNQYFKGEKERITISEGGIWLRRQTLEGAAVFRIGYVDLKNSTLKDVMILEYDTQNFLKKYLRAKQAFFHKENQSLFLKDVWLAPVHTAPSLHKDMTYPMVFSPAELQESHKLPETLTFWKLPYFIHLLEKSGLSPIKYKMHLHTLMAKIFWLIAMVILAAAFSLRPIRQRYTVSLIITGVFLGFILYFVRDITYAMGQAGSIPVFLAAWGPPFLCFLVGTTLLLHLEEG